MNKKESQRAHSITVTTIAIIATQSTSIKTHPPTIFLWRPGVVYTPAQLLPQAFTSLPHPSHPSPPLHSAALSQLSIKSIQSFVVQIGFLFLPALSHLPRHGLDTGHGPLNPHGQQILITQLHSTDAGNTTHTHTDVLLPVCVH